MIAAARFLPHCAEELHRRGIDRPDVLLISGDAYVDHPSFGAAVVGRLLESWGLVVAIAAQPEWRDAEALVAYGPPRLFIGITAGNMDSMVNHLTAHRKHRRDDAYSSGGRSGLRPNRASVVYAQLARRAFPDGLIILGGIEASLRRFAHYDYWEDGLRRSILLDARADLLVYGMAERPLRSIVDRLAPLGEVDRRTAPSLYGIRGTGFVLGQRETNQRKLVFTEDSELRFGSCGWAASGPTPPTEGFFRDPSLARFRLRLLPSYEEIQVEPRLLARATRTIERTSFPSRSEACVQRHGAAFVIMAPPAWPLTTEELDAVHELPYTRTSHPVYTEPVPAAEMIRSSIQITRGCFGGCTFCALTLHEGKIVQSRSQTSVLREAMMLRDRFGGGISDLGGPTANLWRMGCLDRELQARCRRPSCLYPRICPNLGADHGPLRGLMRTVRELPNVRHVHIASGLRHDLALRDPSYLEDLVRYHLGGHLHVAPEHVDPVVLRLARKPPYEVFERFRERFERTKIKTGLERYLNPYFISGLPGSTDERMADLVRKLRAEGWRPRQVQSFVPTPGTLATAMFHSGVNPYRPEENIEMPRTPAEKIRQHEMLTKDLPSRR